MKDRGRGARSPFVQDFKLYETFLLALPHWKSDFIKF